MNANKNRKLQPARKGRPSKARPCRIKACTNLAVTGQKICEEHLATRAKKRTARQSPAPSKTPRRLSQTHRAIAAREQRRSEKIQAVAKLSTDDEILANAREAIERRKPGEPILIESNANDDGIGMATVFKALDIISGWKKPEPDVRPGKGIWSAPTSPHPTVVIGRQSANRRIPSGTRASEGGRSKLRDPEERYPAWLRGDE